MRLRLTRIWISVDSTEKPTVARMMNSEGITSVGAKRKICPTYRREVREVRPVFRIMLMSVEQS